MIDTQYYKQKLEEEKEMLLGELNSISAPNPNIVGDWEAKEETNYDTADLNIRADAREEIEVRHAISNPLELRLREVKRALKRIENGTFGICEISGEEIEEERLRANPAATTCMKHLEKSNGKPHGA